MFTIGESRAISHANDTEQQAQQVAGNPRRRRLSTKNSIGERQLKFIGSGEHDDNIVKLLYYIWSAPYCSLL